MIQTLLLLMIILFQSCSDYSHVKYKKISPSNLIQASNGNTRIVLTLKAFERLGVETVQVSAGAEEVDLPSSALLYDNNGNLWVYVQQLDRTFHREEVNLHKISKSIATVSFQNQGRYLVVISAAAELYGTESGVGK